MKKFIGVVGVMIMLFSLSGCGTLGTRTSLLNSEYKSETEAINEAETTIIEALNTKNSDLIKSVFSEKALSRAEDIDIGIDYIFNSYKGDFIEVTDRNNSSEDHFSDKGQIKEVSAWCYIKTSETTYKLSYLFYPINDIDKTAVGVYSLWLHDYSSKPDNEFNYYCLAGVDFPERYVIHETTESITQYLKSRNVKEIKNLFSQQALSKSSDIADGLEYTFDLFNEADVIGDYGCWVHYDDLFGVRQQHAYMDIDTTSGRFVVYFQYNTSENMNEQGIYRIKVTKIDSSKTYDDYLLGDEYENSGVYNPDWDITN